MESARVVNIGGVPLEDLPHIWPQVVHWIDAALEYDGDHTSYDAKCMIEDTGAQLWIIDVDYGLLGTAITQINIAPQRKVLTVWVVGGSGLDLWVGPLEDTLSRFALEKGCQAIQMIGRRGWKKHLGPLGWNEASTIFVKGLEDG